MTELTMYFPQSEPDIYTTFKWGNTCKNEDRNTYLSASLTQLAKLLSVAATEGKFKEVSKLIANGASVHALGPLGMNPLHLASMNGHHNVCRVLLNTGVVLNSKNKVGKTALHLAAVRGHEKVVHHLLSSGADVDLCDMLGMTPLHWACDRGHFEVVKLLLHHNADPNLLNKFHKTPLDLAREKNRLDIIDLIKDAQEKDPPKCSLEKIKNILTSSLEEYAFGSTENIQRRDIYSEESIESPQPLSTKDKDDYEGGAELDDIEDITNQVEKNALNEEEIDSHPAIYDVDEESLAQDHMLNSLKKLEEITSLRSTVDERLIDSYTREMTADLLMAQNLVSVEDPSSMLRRAIYYGQTIQLTEAGQRALAMIRPEPFIIPYEKSKEKTKREEEKEDIRSSVECNAVVLHNSMTEIVNESSSNNASALNATFGPPVKRYKR